MRSPSGGQARCRDVTHVGKAPPSPETTISDLTRGQVFGEDQIATNDHSPALPDVRPAPQAGCFVSGLLRSHESLAATASHSAPVGAARQSGPALLQARHSLRFRASKSNP